MKTNSTLKLWTLALVLTLSVAACKKKDNPEPAPPPVEVKTMTITELKALSTGASVKVPDNHKVKGIVISDAAAKNIDSKTVIFQEATDKPALIVTFDATQTFAVGDEVELTISNQTLSQVNGEVILQNLPSANVKKTGTGAIEAKQTTIAEIKTNKAAWNGMLVSLNATDLTSADGKYNGSLTVKDATGDLTSSVVTGATFENTALPLSVSKLVGILRIDDNNVRIDVRKAADVTSGDVSSIEYLAILDQFALIGGKTRTARSINPLTIDHSFTTLDLFYSYLFRTNTANQIKNNQNDPAGIYTFTDGAIRPGAKEVTIRFAGSMMQGNIPAYSINDDIAGFTLAPFDAAQHHIKIGIGLVVGSNIAFGTNLLGESPAYNEAGKFYSFKVKLPSTAAELTALGMNNDNGSITDWLANPKIAIYNLSTKRSTAGAYETEAGIAPIIVGDKITIGY